MCHLLHIETSCYVFIPYLLYGISDKKTISLSKTFPIFIKKLCLFFYPASHFNCIVIK